MKLFKHIAILLVMLLVAGTAFGAATTEESGSGSTGADMLAGVDPSGAEIRFWHNHTREREDGLMQMVARFNETNEWGITVIAENQGGYSDIYNKMITGLAGGEVPELVVAYQNQASGYQVAEGLTDLTAYVEHPTWGVDDPSDFFSGFYLADVNAQFGNERLGFPPNRSAEVMYYNQTWLERLGYDGPPQTWDEFEEIVMAAAATSPAGVGYQIRTNASNVYSMVKSRGGDIAAPGGAGYAYNSPELRESMELMKRLYDGGYATKIAERFGDQTAFGNQQVIFTMGSTSGLPFYELAVDAGENGTFEWSVAPIPYTTSAPQVNVYGASVSIPETTPEQQLAAWLFVRWFTEAEQQAEWVNISNYFPVRYSVADGLGSYFEENPRYQDAFSILQTGDSSAEPPYAGYDEVRDLAEAAFNAILDGADIAETLAELDADANEVHEIASP